LEDYKVVKLRKNCIKEFKFIAKIHDYIFSKDKDNYVANYSKIDRAVKQLSNKDKDMQNTCYVAIYNQQIVGYIWLKKNPKSSLKIESLWTLEEFRNQGIASTLCKYATVNEHQKLKNYDLKINEHVRDDIATMIFQKFNSLREELCLETLS